MKTLLIGIVILAFVLEIATQTLTHPMYLIGAVLVGLVAYVLWLEQRSPRSHRRSCP